MKRSKKKEIVYALLFGIFLVGGLGGMYTISNYEAMPYAEKMLVSDEQIDYYEDSWLVFESKTHKETTGIILYPGGKVEAEAYAPLAYQLAEQGFKTIIAPMPLDLAIFAPNVAEDIIKAFPNVGNWYVTGHSLGGVMASRFAAKHEELIDGLILLAAYPQETYDLSQSDLKVLSIYGTEDGVLAEGKIKASKDLLPDTTVWQPIEGGNHAQMGSYGDQKGDNKATLSRETQQELIVNAMTQFIVAK